MTFQKFAEIIANLGGRAFLVGGCVRDEIMGRRCHDHDIVVVGITEFQFVGAFPGAKKTGAAFPVFRIFVSDEEIEVAFARKERKTGEGHNGFEVIFDPSVTLDEDLFRRDLTVNAIAQDILSGELVDPFGGTADIAAKVLRPVSEHFREDPLRVLRVARQAAQFGFDVASETIAMMKSCNSELPTVSQERVWKEMEKALATEQPSKFFRILQSSDSLQVVFPEIAALIGQTQPVHWHPEGDAFEHSMKVLDEVATKTADIETRFCALYHDIGKGATPQEILPHHYGHDNAGEKIILSFPDGRFPAKFKRAAARVAKHHMRVIDMKDAGKVVDTLENVKRACPLEVFRVVVETDSEPKWFLTPEVVDEIFASVPIPDEVKARDGEYIRQFVRNARIHRVKAIRRRLQEQEAVA